MNILHVERPGRAIAYFNYWLRTINNPRYDELLPRLENVTHYQALLSDYIPLRYLEFRLWWLLSRRLIYPLVLPRLRRIHSVLFSTDTTQIEFFDGPVVLDVDDPPHPLDETFIKACNRPNVVVIVVPTTVLKKKLRRGGVKKPMIVLPQGVSMRDFHAEKAQRIGARYKNLGEVVVGFAAPGLYLQADISEGNTRRRMDCMDELLDVVEQARAEVPQIVVWLFGRPSARLQNYAKQRPWIKLFGYVPHSQLLNYIANLDIAVYPRRVDLGGRFSVKLAEFMALGIPVVSTNVSESFIVAEAGGGIITETTDEFVNAIVELATSSELRRSLGEAGRRYGRELDWDLLARRYQREVFDVYTPV